MGTSPHPSPFWRWILVCLDIGLPPTLPLFTSRGLRHRRFKDLLTSSPHPGPGRSPKSRLLSLLLNRRPFNFRLRSPSIFFPLSFLYLNRTQTYSGPLTEFLFHFVPSSTLTSLLPWTYTILTFSSTTSSSLSQDLVRPPPSPSES